MQAAPEYCPGPPRTQVLVPRAQGRVPPWGLLCSSAAPSLGQPTPHGGQLCGYRPSPLLHGRLPGTPPSRMVVPPGQPCFSRSLTGIVPAREAPSHSLFPGTLTGMVTQLAFCLENSAVRKTPPQHAHLSACVHVSSLSRSSIISVLSLSKGHHQPEPAKCTPVPKPLWTALSSPSLFQDRVLPQPSFRPPPARRLPFPHASWGRPASPTRLQASWGQAPLHPTPHPTLNPVSHPARCSEQLAPANPFSMGCTLLFLTLRFILDIL